MSKIPLLVIGLLLVITLIVCVIGYIKWDQDETYKRNLARRIPIGTATVAIPNGGLKGTVAVPYKIAKIWSIMPDELSSYEIWETEAGRLNKPIVAQFVEGPNLIRMKQMLQRVATEYERQKTYGSVKLDWTDGKMSHDLGVDDTNLGILWTSSSPNGSYNVDGEVITVRNDNKGSRDQVYYIADIELDKPWDHGTVQETMYILPEDDVAEKLGKADPKIASELERVRILDSTKPDRSFGTCIKGSFKGIKLLFT